MSFTNPPLSGSDIKKRLHGKTRVLLYEELAKYNEIDDSWTLMATALFS